MTLQADRVADLAQRAKRLVDEGETPACQVAVGYEGRVEFFEAFGAADRRSRFVTFSVTKALSAGVAWRALDEGVIALDTRVADALASFGANGKDLVEVRHLLTHTSGFPNAPLGPPTWFTREGRLEKMGRWRLDHPPGEQCIYHPTAAHWALAEMLAEITSRDFRDLAAELIGDLGLTSAMLGSASSSADWTDVIDLVETGEPPTPEEMRELTGLAIDLREITNDILLRYNGDEIRSLGVPGGGLIANAADIALLYQQMLHDPGGVWSPEMRALGTATICSGELTDPMFGHLANRTLGLVLAGDDGNAAFRQSFGHRVSPRAFGHAGAGGQIAWADPETGISFCFLRNGLDRHVVRSGRTANGLSSRAATLSQPGFSQPGG